MSIGLAHDFDVSFSYAQRQFSETESARSIVPSGGTAQGGQRWILNSDLGRSWLRVAAALEFGSGASSHSP